MAGIKSTGIALGGLARRAFTVLALALTVLAPAFMVLVPRTARWGNAGWVRGQCRVGPGAMTSGRLGATGGGRRAAGGGMARNGL
ncbi:hypothetical protein [Paractinoplanes rishiriensis]|uniref:Uncharacterized protein n=1 Tax=Paractinoplanes rishiriensis TaxID=1050105 RepID=A0A919MR91_9ACTN|nr:hypothetical protein [Actinoplanes rishiriensis]GIE96966.1 hypothetical protein Ari01nite_44310 [Actinoplanes rishiriensis]